MIVFLFVDDCYKGEKKRYAKRYDVFLCNNIYKSDRKVGNLMAYKQLRGRCRVSVKDIRHIKRYDYGLWLFIENEVFNQKYKKKALKGNDLLIQQGTRELKDEFIGRFIIQKSNFGEQFTQIKVARTEKTE